MLRRWRWGPAPGTSATPSITDIDSLGVGRVRRDHRSSVTFLAPDPCRRRRRPAPEPDAHPDPAGTAPATSSSTTACVEADFDGDRRTTADVTSRSRCGHRCRCCTRAAWRTRRCWAWSSTKSPTLAASRSPVPWTPGRREPGAGDTTRAVASIRRIPTGSTTVADEFPLGRNGVHASGSQHRLPGMAPDRAVGLSCQGSSPVNFYMPETGLPMTPDERAG